MWWYILNASDWYHYAFIYWVFIPNRADIKWSQETTHTHTHTILKVWIVHIYNTITGIPQGCILSTLQLIQREREYRWAEIGWMMYEWKDAQAYSGIHIKHVHISIYLYISPRRPERQILSSETNTHRPTHVYYGYILTHTHRHRQTHRFKCESQSQFGFERNSAETGAKHMVVGNFLWTTFLPIQCFLTSVVRLHDESS